ncbi:MAG: cytochrome b N-terminal domain-containing protein [Rubrivivax sp.]
MPGPGLESLRQRGLSAWRSAERALDRVGGAAANPLRHLGAIAMLAFWLVTASGVVLYIFFETSVGDAYPSVERMAHWPLGSGALLRGLHRYGTDVLVLATGLHLLREWLHGHERGFRRFSWLTGTGLIAFVFVAGIGGFWLPWDRLAQYSATATAEWLDALPLPLFPTPFARNFIASVDDRLFSLFIFVHVGVSLLMLFALWFHVQRISRPAAWPARAVAWPMCAMLTVVSLALPVQSAPPAALATAPAALSFDWIVLFVHPLVDASSAAAVWAAVGAATLFLFGLPFLPTQRRARARRWRWSIRTTAMAASAASPTAPTKRCAWCRTPTSASAARWPSSTPISAPAAASAPAPALRRRRSAAPPRSSPASTCRSSPSARCGSGCNRRSRNAMRPGRSSSSAANKARVRPRSPAKTCAASTSSAPASCRRRSSSTRCATAPPACWWLLAPTMAASSASAIAGRASG